METTLMESASKPSKPGVSRSSLNLAHPLIEGPEKNSFFQTLPSWWQERLQKAWQKYQSLPMPQRKDEDWRFANINAIQIEPYALSSSPLDKSIQSILDRSHPSFESLGQATFLNHYQIQSPTLPKEWGDKKVIWETIENALQKHPELLKKYFMSRPVALGSEKFAALHEAYAVGGSIIYVPANVQIELPLVNFYWMSGEHVATFPHTLIIAEANSKVTVVDICQSDTDTHGFACAYSDLILSAGAQVTHISIQNWSEKALAFHMNSSLIERDASARTLMVNLGSHFLRTENRSRLIGAASRSEMLALSVGHSTQEFDQRTLQDHLCHHGWSDLLYKNSLNHQAKSIFQGLIRVEPGAYQTDAYQTNRNLLLSGEAEADSMPGLEILNDDVKCSHGATTGQVEEELLFYMMARGIPPTIAKHLLVVGFFEEVIDRLNIKSIGTYLEKLVEEKFTRSQQIRFTPSKESAELTDEHNVRQLQGTQ